MKYMIIISYDGSKFHGFQRQNNVKSVQKELEKGLSKLLNEDILIKGAGRTDYGVHAKYQVCHFITNKNITLLKYKLNKILKDIKVKKIKKVNNDFHARYNVKNKTYLYKIDLSNNKDNRYYGQVKSKLDIKKMKNVSKLFLGTHNFKNFVSGKRLNYNSTIIDIKIFKFNNILYLKFKGIGFYRYMVRNLVGSLIEVGKGKVNKNKIQDMLDNYDKEQILPTASSQGLYLIKIKY